MAGRGAADRGERPDRAATSAPRQTFERQSSSSVSSTTSIGRGDRPGRRADHGHLVAAVAQHVVDVATSAPRRAARCASRSATCTSGGRAAGGTPRPARACPAGPSGSRGSTGSKTRTSQSCATISSSRSLRSPVARYASRSLSRRRAWFSPASSPVSRSRRREWCPASTTLGWMRTCVPVSSCPIESSPMSKPRSLRRSTRWLMRQRSDWRERLGDGELRPQVAVRRRRCRRRPRPGRRPRRGGRRPARSSSSPAMFTRRDLEVVLALPVRQAAVVELAGLGIHQVGGEGAGIAAEQGVRQRHVAPEEADDVQPREQHGERVDEAGRGVGAQRLRVQRAVGERELEVAGDERGLRAPRRRRPCGR